MRMERTQRPDFGALVVGCLLTGLAVLSGCGDGRLARYPVSGTVMVDGKPAVVGVVSWSTGPKMSAGCGGMTGLTPLTRYRDWIVRTLRSP